MLHAVNNRKARLNAFRSAGVRVPLEDVVTSTVFGPLEFMAPDDRERAVMCIAEALSLPWPIKTGELEMRFWPRLQLVDSELRVRYSEPDLIIADVSGSLAMFEVKWGAQLSEHELAAQWAALTPSERRRSVHVLLVQEPELYRRAVESDAERIERLGLGPWHFAFRSWRLLAALTTISSRPGTSLAVQRWAIAISAFLRREHRFAIHGWLEIGLRSTESLTWSYQQPWFAGLPTVENHKGWWTHA